MVALAVVWLSVSSEDTQRRHNQLNLIPGQAHIRSMGGDMELFMLMTKMKALQMEVKDKMVRSCLINVLEDIVDPFARVALKEPLNMAMVIKFVDLVTTNLRVHSTLDLLFQMQTVHTSVVKD